LKLFSCAQGAYGYYFDRAEHSTAR